MLQYLQSVEGDILLLVLKLTGGRMECLGLNMQEGERDAKDRRNWSDEVHR